MITYTFWDFFLQSVLIVFIGVTFWVVVSTLVFVVVGLILGRTKTYGAVNVLPTPQLRHLRLVRHGLDRPGDLEEVSE